MTRWLACCRREDKTAFEAVARALGAEGVSFAATPDILRRVLLSLDPGEESVLVGETDEGVSEVNLAAALVSDGHARNVVLAKREPSGSLLSRAARAGVDSVVNLSDYDCSGELTCVLGGSDAASQAPRPKSARGSGVRSSGARGSRTRPSAPRLSLVPAQGPSLTVMEGDAQGVGTAANKERVKTLLAEVPSVEEPAAVKLQSVSAPSQIAAVPAKAPGQCPVITLCSGRGGVGKTSLVALFAAFASQWGMHVCALDLDLACGNLYSCYGLPGMPDLADMAAVSRLDDSCVQSLLSEVTANLFVAGPCERPESAELVMPHVQGLISYLSGTFDLVLVDTSSTFTDAVAAAAQMADRVVLVGDDRPGSIAAVARMSGLAVRLGVARARIARIENRADPRTKMDFSLGRAEVGLEAARIFRVFEGDVAVTDYLAAGETLDLIQERTPFAESCGITLAQLLEELGCLPKCDAAQKAARGNTAKRRSALFGLWAEAK